MADSGIRVKDTRVSFRILSRKGRGQRRTTSVANRFSGFVIVTEWKITPDPSTVDYLSSYYIFNARHAQVKFASPFHQKWDQSLELLAPPETMLGKIIAQFNSRLQ
ncbi:hypothetical protein SARC_04003 [Sphaeroforma arctica JP610]|uniref:Uncharacterized protein n=1 Tax=Sphaeroforma arctica JP610 TaxID=667725 RepID=A0A0L0G6B2_9EUKA|nr:hypothetical protein SARC_04003 [Sphaeroforma arctica JP610]KNC83753.1 hypothetical protein SARC_04003 [Sphaeroforma arctica JP610]|eukprot:XP_014157655.1 hypothetical protein SARC_04003 [Sphaeroforma arctica JP610]